MPVIILKFRNKVLREYPIESGQTFTIGRQDSNDITIDNIAVSGNHARIDSVATTFILTDLQSTNGTFVNDQLISSHTLGHNDKITIGKHELVFDYSIPEQKIDVANDDDLTDDKTRILDTAEYRELINNLTGNVTPASPPETTEQSILKKCGDFFSNIFKRLFG